MTVGVFVSRLGLVLRDRHLGVSELQRRLQRRGHPISRGALDRLMSRRPVQSVDLDVLVPVLDELGVDFRTAFEQLPTPVAQAEAIARPAAREAAQRITRRGALIEADLELEQASNRLQAELRTLHPELFDRRGRLRRRMLERLLVERAEGRTALEDDVLREFLMQEDQPSRPDAA